jgi:hypothetical protein
MATRVRQLGPDQGVADDMIKTMPARRKIRFTEHLLCLGVFLFCTVCMEIS